MDWDRERGGAGLGVRARGAGAAPRAVVRQPCNLPRVEQFTGCLHLIFHP